jgi:hypothetical protein
MGLEMLGAVQQAPQLGLQWMRVRSDALAGAWGLGGSDLELAINFVAFLSCVTGLQTGFDHALAGLSAQKLRSFGKITPLIAPLCALWRSALMRPLCFTPKFSM